MFGVWEPSGVPKMFKMKRDTGLFMQIYTNFKKPLICMLLVVELLHNSTVYIHFNYSPHTAQRPYS